MRECDVLISHSVDVPISTTYIGQTMARERDAEPNSEYATRMGALSMLLNSIVAALAGALLPYLSRRDNRLLRVQDEDEEEESTRLRNMIYEWRVEAAKKGKPMRLPTLPVLYRTIWIGALLLFTLLTMITFFVKTTAGVRVTNRSSLFSESADRLMTRPSSSLVWSVFPGLLHAGCHSQLSWR